MANASIYAAFERMWQQTLSKLGNKADKTYVDSQITEANKYTDDSVANLLNNSSEAVDSIFELRDAMEDNADAIEALTTIAGSKVDKVEGKGLSTNDYTTEEKNKLAGIAAGAEANVQSDWNQNDETTDDYIKNRPFYEESVIAINEQTVTIDTDRSYVTIELDKNSLLPYGGTFIVTFDGVDYKCIGKSWDYRVTACGNATIKSSQLNPESWPNTGEPFFLLDDEGVAGVEIYAEKAGTHTIKVVQQIDIKTIDPKYLPDEVFVQSDWNQNDETAKDYIKNKPFGERVVSCTYIEETHTFEDSDYFDFVDFGSYFVSTTKSDIFTVIFDNEEYILTRELITVSSNGTQIYCAGNKSFISDEYEDTGEPFCIKGTYDGVEFKVRTPGDHDIKLIMNDIYIETIDYKYLPYDIATTNDVYMKYETYSRNEVDALIAEVADSTTKIQMVTWEAND